jgi:hypothetical protein
MRFFLASELSFNDTRMIDGGILMSIGGIMMSIDSTLMASLGWSTAAP